MSDPMTVACSGCQAAMPEPASGPVLCPSCYMDAPKKVKVKMQNATLEQAIAELMAPPKPPEPAVVPDLVRDASSSPARSTNRNAVRGRNLEPARADRIVEAIGLRRQGLGYREIGAAMGTSKTTAKRDVQRGLDMTVANAADALRADEGEQLAKLWVVAEQAMIEPQRVDGRVVTDPASGLAVRNWKVAESGMRLALQVVDRTALKLYGPRIPPGTGLGSDAERAVGVAAVGTPYAEFDRRLERQEDAELAAAQKRVRGEHELARRTRRNKDKADAAVFEPPVVTASYTEDAPVADVPVPAAPVAPPKPPVDAQAVRDAAERRQMNAAIRRRAF